MCRSGVQVSGVTHFQSAEMGVDPRSYRSIVTGSCIKMSCSIVCMSSGAKGWGVGVNQRIVMEMFLSSLSSIWRASVGLNKERMNESKIKDKGYAQVGTRG